MTTDPSSAHDDSSEHRPIIVGVDGSPSSKDALNWAVRQAGLVGAEVHAVIAWQYPPVYGMYAINADIDWAAAAQEAIDVAVKEALGGTSDGVTSIVTQGHPAQVLVDASDDAQLVVVGNRGHGGFAQALLGSVSEQVVTHATCPVLVIRTLGSSQPAPGSASTQHN